MSRSRIAEARARPDPQQLRVVRGLEFGEAEVGAGGGVGEVGSDGAEAAAVVVEGVGALAKIGFVRATR